MPEILIPSRWTSQPQYPVDIDWSNPLTRDLEYVLLGSQRFLNPTKLPIVRSGNIESIPTYAGVGSILQDTVYDSYLLPVGQTTGGTTNWTIAGVVVPIALSASIANANGNVLCSVTEAPNTSGSWDRAITMQNTSHNWRAYLFDGATKLATSTAVATVGKADKIIATCSGSSLIMAVDGVADASVAVSNNGFNSYTSAEFNVGDPQNLGGIGQTAITLMIRSRVFWPESYRRAFFANPWQIFKPQVRRIFFEVAGAAGTHTTTGAIAAQSSVIAGTAAHSALHATSGALASQSASVAGTATHKTLHATSGALSSSSATVSGTAVHPHVTSGALAAQPAIIVGVAERSVAGTHDTTGALSSGAAVIAGTAAHIAIHATSGALSAQSAVIAGTSVHTAAGSGTGATVEEIWAYEIEPGVTAKMALQRLLAVMGGKVSGAGTGTEVFRDINDTRDALISTNDSNGNRTGLTWNDGP